MKLNLITAPTFEPITLEELKRHTVIGHEADDDYLFSLIEAAREQVEADTGRALVEQTWELVAEGFGSEIILPKPPLASVTHIKYIDTDGAEQTLAASEYQVVTNGVGARIKPAYGKSWPAVQAGTYNAVQVRFVAGYMVDDLAGGFTGNIPFRARQAILIHAATLYENRESLSPVQLHDSHAYDAAIAGLQVDLI